MNDKHDHSEISKQSVSFFDRPTVQKEVIPVGNGVPVGFEEIYHPDIQIGGVYGTWGEGYDNEALVARIQEWLDEPLRAEDLLNLSPLGFVNRHHIANLSDEDNLEAEVEIGARYLRKAAAVNGWDPSEVEGVLVGMSGPVVDDYTERIAKRAGIPDSALKVSIHKACDSSAGALHLALNPDLPYNQRTKTNIAEELYGKKILVGAIEGLSRFINRSQDKSAMQLFGNGAGMIGVIPGQTMEFLVGKTHEAFDEMGVLAVKMFYPHSRSRGEGDSMVEVSQVNDHHIRVAGLMHEPKDGRPVEMAGPMGMVKLFVRTGVEVVREVYNLYQDKMNEWGESRKDSLVTVVHHANLKINLLKHKHLQREGIELKMPWVLSEFGNVSAASNMIAFLRQLPEFSLGDHILIDGFGAGTYYDTFAVALGDWRHPGTLAPAGIKIPKSK